MENMELKQCPFCGGRATYDDGVYEKVLSDTGSAVMSVKCTECGAELSAYSFQEDDASPDAMRSVLAERWNRRPKEIAAESSIEDLHEEIRELESSLKEVGQEAHKYLGKWTKELKRNEVLRRVIVMREIESVCPDLAHEYKEEAAR